MICNNTSFLFFFNDTATTEIYTLSLHDALPIFGDGAGEVRVLAEEPVAGVDRLGPTALDGVEDLLGVEVALGRDRKSTRLNSSHANISYAVFCLKKKNITHA